MHTYNVTIFQKPKEIAFYLLGAFCTDGCIRVHSKTKSAVLVSKDIDWINQVNSFVAPDKPIKIQLKKYSRIEWFSKEIIDWFITYGCLPRKSLTLEVNGIPKKYLSDFIRGCWDGDGTLGLYHSKKEGKQHINKLQCTLTTGSKKFANQIQKYLSDLKIESSIYKRILKPRKIGERTINVSSVIYTVNLTNKKSINRFCKVIYYNNNKISMPRKSILANSLLSASN